MSRELPADVYDTLELGALEYGGIGGAFLTRLDASGEYVPYCIYGFARELDSENEIRNALIFAGIGVLENDIGVTNVNRTRDDNASGVYDYDRISFDDWTKELNVIRGE